MQEGIYIQRLWDELQDHALNGPDLTKATSKLVLRTDSSAARRIMQKHGTTRAKHVALSVLWVQKLVQEQRARVTAVSTLTNVSDLFTKPLAVRRCKLLLYLLKQEDLHMHGRVGETEFAEGLNKQATRLTVQDALRVLRTKFGNQVQAQQAKNMLRVAMMAFTPIEVKGQFAEHVDEQKQCSLVEMHDFGVQKIYLYIVGFIFMSIGIVVGLCVWVRYREQQLYKKCADELKRIDMRIRLM